MILASQSPRRLELLREIGLDPQVRPAHIDETPQAGENPEDLVLRLSREKAAACGRELGDSLAHGVVLAADTTVWLDGRSLGKPEDDAQAREMLALLSGRTHHVSTGVCLRLDGFERCFVETSDVTFFPLTAAQIDAYVQSGEPRDKAGAYGIQGLGRLLVEGIRGDFFNVVGLPVARTVRELSRLLQDAQVPEDTFSCGKEGREKDALLIRILGEGHDTGR